MDDAKALVQSGAKMVRTQDQTMQSIAELKPRAIKTVQARGMEEIDAFPDDAYRWYYSIPYKEYGEGGKVVKTVAVEGPSIHLALMLQRYWGNCDSAWEYDTETEDHVWLKGIFVDMETNTRFQKSFRVSKKGKRKKDNVVFTLRDDKLTQAINAGGSKAQRNAIIAGIPDPLVSAFVSRAKALMKGDKPKDVLAPETIQHIEGAFAGYGVPLDAVERAVKQTQDKWTGETRAKLMGMFNALKEGASVEDVIGKPAVKKTQGKAAKKKAGTKATKSPPSAPPEGSGVVVGGPVEPEVVDESDDPFGSDPLFQ